MIEVDQAVTHRDPQISQIRNSAEIRSTVINYRDAFRAFMPLGREFNFFFSNL
jgi:hypothetical protein